VKLIIKPINIIFLVFFGLFSPNELPTKAHIPKQLE